MKNIKQRGFINKNNNTKNIDSRANDKTNGKINSKNFTIVCPWCERPTIILAINCGIFRHGVFKKNMVQIPPHTPKNVCDKLIQEDKIYGCGKSFRIENNGNVLKCDYI